jgi:hypothetical protein
MKGGAKIFPPRNHPLRALDSLHTLGVSCLEGNDQGTYSCAMRRVREGVRGRMSEEILLKGRLKKLD